MAAQLLEQVHQDRRDGRLYSVERENEFGQKRIVQKFWHQLDDAERASLIEAEQRAYYEVLFSPNYY